MIDLVCYRRRGHNETDEPSGTQPLMYAAIKQHRSTRALYAESLIAQGILSESEANALSANFRKELDTGQHVVKSLVKEPSVELFVDWSPYLGHDWSPHYNTSMPVAQLRALAKKLVELPADLSLQKQVQKVYQDRSAMAAGDAAVDWGFAETLAYASVLTSGNEVRITGQDVGRGTFSHRHAVIHDLKLEMLTSS